MSPAKRKSAKSGRAATVAARGGKARGKAPGPALTKAVKVKGKTPARRGDHRSKASGGAKTGAKNGEGVACDLPREKLELLLDRDGGQADVLTHVPACHPCTTALTVIAAQRDAVRHLMAEPAGTAVEYLLERGARAGGRKLADLIYELTKACLVVVKDIDRRVDLVARPRGHRAIGQDVEMIASRHNGGMHRSLASRLPVSKPVEATALVAAESCITILEHLEGSTARCVLSNSVRLICSGRAAEAQNRLAEMIEKGIARDVSRHAYRNLLWSMIRQQKYAEALSLGAEVIRAVGNDWVCLYNLAVAAADIGDVQSFRRYAAILRRVGPEGGGGAGWRHGLLTFELTRMAGQPLGFTEAQVARELGIEVRSSDRDAVHAL